MTVPLSKRRPISNPNSLGRRLLIVFGVFFLLLAFTPVKAEARGSYLEPGVQKVTPLEKKEEQLDQLKVTFEIKGDLVEEKREEYHEVKQVTDEVTNTKETLAEKLERNKRELEVLKARLAEKQRQDALRIVVVDKSASGSAGNTYAPGNCTWYVKSKRTDLPNMMGNAKYWYSSAKARGYRTGTVAKTNAVGVSFGGWAGHVVYVEKWLGDGKILISEMNVSGLYSQQSRIADESEFVYIYELI